MQYLYSSTEENIHSKTIEPALRGLTAHIRLHGWTLLLTPQDAPPQHLVALGFSPRDQQNVSPWADKSLAQRPIKMTLASAVKEVPLFNLFQEVFL